MDGFAGKGFEELEGKGVETPKATVSEKTKEKNEAVKLTEAKLADPDFSAALNTLSPYLEVINTLSHDGESSLVGGGMKTVTDEHGKEKEVRELIPTSGIVGYRVQNISDSVDVPYTTVEYEKDENGVYVGREVAKVLAPGQIADLTKRSFVATTCIPEFSFVIANGTVIKSSRKSKTNSVTDLLDQYYFKANANTGIKVNSDEMKINISEAVIDENGKEKFVVAEEHVITFGYLNNEPEKDATKKEKKRTVTNQTVAASYVHDIITGNLSL